MKKFPLITLITLSLATNALAADPATSGETLSQEKNRLSTPLKKQGIPRNA